MPKDPVCKMEVNPEDANAKYKYKNKTYYFCAEACKKSFENNPDKYL
jgi:YHS domain-containing protein